MEQRFYFEPGISFGTFGVKDEVRLIKQLENEYQLNITARDNWVELDGSDASVKAVLKFFDELQKLCKLRQKELDRADFELVLRQCRFSDAPALENLWKERIELASGRRPVMPRSLRQLEYLKAMRKHEVVFGIGPAGTGKTYLAVAAAVAAFRERTVNRIILTRPAVEAGERLGFLPGDLQNKVDPYLRPLYDALYDMLGAETFQKYQERGSIEVAPLAYMRGRTLDDSFIILDEAQNTTREQMKMFLTRLGFGSRIVITGDVTQIDLPDDKVSGLT